MAARVPNCLTTRVSPSAQPGLRESHRIPGLILPTTRPRALIALHGAVLLFGLSGLFGKWLDLPPVLIVLGRTAVAAVALR